MCFYGTTNLTRPSNACIRGSGAQIRQKDVPCSHRNSVTNLVHEVNLPVFLLLRDEEFNPSLECLHSRIGCDAARINRYKIMFEWRAKQIACCLTTPFCFAKTQIAHKKQESLVLKFCEYLMHCCFRVCTRKNHDLLLLHIAILL